jgi:hypothetical protein
LIAGRRGAEIAEYPADALRVRGGPEGAPMLVSNFYVGYNQTSWPGGQRTAAGYALQITNLESRPIEFDIECRVTRLFGQTAGQSDKAFLTSLFGGRVWRKDALGHYASDRWEIDANGVGEWRLAMSGGRVTWPWGGAWDERRIFDVLGYVSLRVPVRRADVYPYGLVPQSGAPVRVLLSAWREDQWLVAGQSEQVQSSSVSAIPLATGKALNEISPDLSIYFRDVSVTDFITGMTTRKAMTDLPRGATDLAEDDRVPALVDLLGALSRDEREIQALNQLLQDSGVPLSVRETYRV